MKMSVPEILHTVKARSGRSWKAMARAIGVSFNSPKSWADGGHLSERNREKLRAWLDLTPNQMTGLDAIPQDFWTKLRWSDEVQAKGSETAGSGSLSEAQLREIIERALPILADQLIPRVADEVVRRLRPDGR